MSAPVLLNLGTFQFGLDTAVFEELQRSSAYTWAELPRIGVNPALQFTGVEAETITLPGKIYPHFRGGLGQVDAMRTQAALGKPLLLVDGLGSVKGFWCITRIDEGRKMLWGSGAPRLQEFTVELKYYGPNGTDTQPRTYPTVQAAVGTATAGRITKTAKGAPSRVQPTPHVAAQAPQTPDRVGHYPQYPFGVINLPFIGPIRLPLPNLSLPPSLTNLNRTLNPHNDLPLPL
jgi:phage protein U